MEHSQGVLLIQKQKSATSGEWEQFAKIGISKSSPPEDIVPGLPDEILTLCAIHSPMPEVLKSQILKRFSHLRASQNRLLLENHLAENNIASEAENIAADQNKHLSILQAKQQLKHEISSGQTRKPTSEERLLHNEVINAKLEFDKKKAELKIIERKLAKEISESAGVEGVIKLSKRRKKPTLQKVNLKADYKKLYEDYEHEETPQIRGYINLKNQKSIEREDPTLYSALIHSKVNTDFTSDQLDQPLIEKTELCTFKHGQYLKKMNEVTKAKWLFELLMDKLVVSVGGDDEIDGLVSWRRVKRARLIFDEVGFAQDYPKIYSEYLNPEKVAINYRVSRFGIYSSKN